jgi:predicted kinase
MLPREQERGWALASVRKDEVPVELVELQVPTQEWRAILTARPNVLVEGSDGRDRLVGTSAKCPSTASPPIDVRTVRCRTVIERALSRSVIAHSDQQFPGVNG